MSWECVACTWSNDECDVNCSMCQTKRPRNLSPNTRKLEDDTVCRAADDSTNASISLLQQNNNDDNKIKELTEEVKPQSINEQQQQQQSIQNSDLSNQQGKKSAQNEISSWDAFASLENNYESSDSDEDESDSDSDTNENQHKHANAEYDGNDYDKIGADQSQWNAFQSLEATLGDDSSSSCSSSGEESDCILIEDEDERKMPHAKTVIKSNCEAEYVDLVDTDDDDDNVQEKNRKARKVKTTTTKRKRASDPSTMTLADGDSDSSYLSEVESSRPLQSSPATRQGVRSLPPWQRTARSKSTSTPILQNDRTRPRESFSLLNNRNDLNGSGLNETRTSAPPPAAARQPKQRKSSAKSSSRRRKRSSSDDAAPAKKKRRTRKYRRSSKRGGRGGRGTAAASSSSRSNNAWGARERGMRPARDNGSYMNITKQEPMLRNIGGASIQF